MIGLYIYAAMILVSMIAITIGVKKAHKGTESMPEILIMSGVIIVASICWPVFWLMIAIGRYIRER